MSEKGPGTIPGNDSRRRRPEPSAQWPQARSTLTKPGKPGQYSGVPSGDARATPVTACGRRSGRAQRCAVGSGGRGRRGALAVGLAAAVGRRGARVALAPVRARRARRGGRAVRRAAVRAVEAGALEDDADRREDLAQPSLAARALGQRVVGELLHHLELLGAGGTGVLVGGHALLLNGSHRLGTLTVRLLRVRLGLA